MDFGSKAWELLGLRGDRDNSSSPSSSSSYPPDLQETDVNLIITDYCMLGMTRYDLLKRVKTCPDYVHKDLTSQGSFDIISDVLHSQDKALVSAGTNILVHFLNQDPNLLRSYIARQAENSREGISLLGLLLMESAKTITTSVVHMRTKAEERGPGKEEEEYLNNDSNEKDSATRMTSAQQQSIVKLANGSEIHRIPARSKSGCLVDYDDNDKDGSSSPEGL